jgi:hypothetical protein
VRSNAGWLHQALPLEPRPPANYTAKVSVNGLHTSADFDIPHGEFFFAPDPTGQFFSVQQFQCYISVMRGPGDTGRRLLLKAGYHRSYARARSMMPPAATVPSAVVALERNTFGDPPNQAVGAGLIVDTSGLRPAGRRPALLGDFFDEEIVYPVLINWITGKLQPAWRCIETTSKGLTERCSYPIQVEAHRDNQATFVRLFPEADHGFTPKHVIVLPDTKIEYLEARTPVTWSEDRKAISFGVSGDVWLKVRIKGQDGWIHSEEDFEAVGLPQAG